MTALDGSIVRIPAPYHFEANELNVMDGKYVYTYCSNWANRDDAEWNAYKAEHGITVGKPDMCVMCYMVSDNPMDPDSWVYKGVYGPHPGNGTNNNHSHLQKFQGNYYHIYHNAVLKESMKAANAIDSSAGIYRSLCVNKATVNESTQTVNRVSTDLKGTEAIKSMNPYELQEAETMATCGGISYEDFTNITKNTRYSNLGNDASQNMQVKMATGSWTQMRSVDFGSEGASKMMVRAKGEGTVEIRLGRKGAKASATFNISSTDMEDYTVDVDAAKFNGLKSVFIVVASGDNVYLDAWQAIAQPAAIQEIENSWPIETQSYDLSGRRVRGNLLDANKYRGIIIEQYTDENGVRHTRKRM